MTRAGTVAAGGLDHDGAALVGAAGAAVTFDGIFGAFFDGYWHQHTDVRDLVLTFDLVGHVEIAVDRVFSSNGVRERIVAAACTGGGERVVLRVPVGDGGETRLVLTIRLVEDSRIAALAWATPAPPVRAIGLVPVICAFNRDRDVAATLGKLLEVAGTLRRILVINQGDPGLAERLRQAGIDAGPDLLTVVDQQNLGGAGGFGRGMLESLSDERCTHVLLMDDDIDLDPQSVARLTTILAYTTRDHAVCGAMLDRRDARTLFTVGDVLHPRKPEICNLIDPNARDITSEATSRYLAIHHRPDFGGWWFFAFSKAAIDAVGLPLPLFIRGDDVEYGYRLAAAGVSTLAWPGLAVWHDPFYLKRHPWHYFYDRRNSLHLCEMHNRFGRVRLAQSLTTGFFNHLLRFDYDRATCITLGLRAFNDGAGALRTWNGADHARLAATFSSSEVTATVSAQSAAAAPPSRLPPLLLFAARFMRDVTQASSTQRTSTVVGSHDWRPTIRHRPPHVRVHYAESRTMANYAHSRRRARACSRQFAVELVRFLLRPRRPDRLRSLTMADFWSSYTASPGLGPAGQ